ncbi:division/cell wall cluster transcriptional repressor MraZ [Patescibacteria group bacterium]|nr:division/cell wall cluster transcriptional repressor MraZ [Patescibacteria group bacterium]MDE2021548.1 division/cell wall cluster transcriptional repressor MraZ [Patescibacteria group bacterium]MDE2173391.1 division/cell wall cluster transcriptional repressor MraZ [Patescibacteria group bacterium]
MFIGEYLHTLDPKNRISLPAKFRKDLGRAVVLTRGLDHCLFVYPKKAWAKEAGSRAAHAGGTAAERGLARLFLAGAMEAEVDAVGRVLVPDHLKNFAGLKAKTVIAGVADRIEIWDETAWKRYTTAIERDADAFAEKLGSGNAT